MRARSAAAYSNAMLRPFSRPEKKAAPSSGGSEGSLEICSVNHQPTSGVSARNGVPDRRPLTASVASGASMVAARSCTNSYHKSRETLLKRDASFKTNSQNRNPNAI